MSSPRVDTAEARRLVRDQENRGPPVSDTAVVGKFSTFLDGQDVHSERYLPCSPRLQGPAARL